MRSQPTAILSSFSWSGNRQAGQLHRLARRPRGPDSRAPLRPPLVSLCEICWIATSGDSPGLVKCESVNKHAHELRVSRISSMFSEGIVGAILTGIDPRCAHHLRPPPRWLGAWFGGETSGLRPIAGFGGRKPRSRDQRFVQLLQKSRGQNQNLSLLTGRLVAGGCDGWHTGSVPRFPSADCRVSGPISITPIVLRPTVYAVGATGGASPETCGHRHSIPKVRILPRKIELVECGAESRERYFATVFAQEPSCGWALM